jgi:TetR/AcrR family transcriptional repressor of nem operon
LSTVDGSADPDAVKRRARAIFAAIGGVQLMARNWADVSVFDTLVEIRRATGL